MRSGSSRTSPWPAARRHLAALAGYVGPPWTVTESCCTAATGRDTGVRGDPQRVAALRGTSGQIRSSAVKKLLSLLVALTAGALLLIPTAAHAAERPFALRYSLQRLATSSRPERAAALPGQ